MTPELYIKHEIENRGMKIKAVADQAGVKYSTLLMALSGHTKLHLLEYLTLCAFFGLDPRGYKEAGEDKAVME